MSLRLSYTFFAPAYDLLVSGATRAARGHSLRLLGEVDDLDVLICGIGTGLDIPHLRPGARYVGVDLTPAMLQRAEARMPAAALELRLELGDAMDLPFADARFDVVVLHLILAVVPRPASALAEASRVLKPGGRVLVLDKFLKPGQTAPLRRLLSPLAGRLATRTDVVFEEALARCPELSVRLDRPAMLGGWFRHVLLEKEKDNKERA